MPTLLSGVFITHQPVSPPSHHVRLPLRDTAETPWTSIIFDGAPGGDVPDVPGTIETVLVGIVTVTNDSGYA